MICLTWLYCLSEVTTCIRPVELLVGGCHGGVCWPLCGSGISHGRTNLPRLFMSEWCWGKWSEFYSPSILHHLAVLAWSFPPSLPPHVHPSERCDCVILFLTTLLVKGASWVIQCHWDIQQIMCQANFVEDGGARGPPSLRTCCVL